MSFIYGTTLAADLFRISYQGVEAASDQTPAQTLTLSERIGQTMKRHIALLEIYLTVQHYIFRVDRFKEWVIPFRVVAIGQGIFELQTNF